MRVRLSSFHCRSEWGRLSSAHVIASGARARNDTPLKRARGFGGAEAAS